MFRQNCPICKKEVRYHPRYPYYLCVNCVNKVTDRSNQPIIYLPSATPKGFTAHYKNNPDQIYLYDLCYLNGKEFKAFPEKGKFIFIQPTDFLEYASRPENDVVIPEDAELTNKKTKGNLIIKKIILPAFVLTFLNTVFPIVSGLTILKLTNGSTTFMLLIYSVINFNCWLFSIKLILNVINKFPNARYFKQHSWSFLLIGLISIVTFIILIFSKK